MFLYHWNLVSLDKKLLKNFEYNFTYLEYVFWVWGIFPEARLYLPLFQLVFLQTSVLLITTTCHLVGIFLLLKKWLSSTSGAIKIEMSLWNWWYFPGFASPFHLRRSWTLIGWFYIQFLHSWHLLSLLNQSHHLCKRQLRRFCLCRGFCCLIVFDVITVRIWTCTLTQLLTVHLCHMRRGRAPLFVAAAVYWLHKPDDDREDE